MIEQDYTQPRSSFNATGIYMIGCVSINIECLPAAVVRVSLHHLVHRLLLLLPLPARSFIYLFLLVLVLFHTVIPFAAQSIAVTRASPPTNNRSYSIDPIDEKRRIIIIFFNNKKSALSQSIQVEEDAAISPASSAAAPPYRSHISSRASFGELNSLEEDDEIYKLLRNLFRDLLFIDAKLILLHGEGGKNIMRFLFFIISRRGGSSSSGTESLVIHLSTRF